MKTVYLVRHAQSRPSTELPDPQWPLSERGHAQAHRLVDVLATLAIEEVHTSPYLRCRDTIAPFVISSAVSVREHRDLRERRVAPSIIDNFADVWRSSWDDFGFALPGCETSHATQQRVHAAVTDICERTTASTLVINSHGIALSLLLNRVDRRFHVERATAMRNPEVLRMSFHAGELAWDAGWHAPLLDEFASHHDETPFPPSRAGSSP